MFFPKQKKISGLVLVVQYEPKYRQGVLSIVGESIGQSALTADDLKKHQARDGIIVSLYNGKVVGYMVYHTGGFAVHIKRIAVLPIYQRRGVATCLIQWLVSAMFQKYGYVHISASVHEENIVSLRFFFKSKFRIKSWVRDIHKGPEEGLYRDSVEMVYVQ